MRSHTIRKIIIMFFAALMTLFALTSCKGGTSGTPDGKLQIVTTIFPEYDWVREIMGDTAGEADITLLCDNGADIHSYQPSAEDILKISTCDVFVYVGGESDKWVQDALDKAMNKDMKAVCLMDVLGDAAVEEEIVEGMQEEQGEDEPEADEHVWLSLKNAATFCEEVKDALSEADPANSSAYEKNTSAYKERLNALDAGYSKAVKKAGKKVLVFGDRFPFRYMTEDYGLKYFAAFSGCSAETEASFETIRFLAEKVDEYGLGCIMTIDGSDQKIAKTIVDNTKEKNQKILTLDSMQSVTQKEIEAGASYLAVMESDLKVLKQALE